MRIQCILCMGEMNVVCRIPGYVEGEHHDVFFCPGCGASRAAVSDNYDYASLYNRIYRAPDKVPGYDRYLRYATRVQHSSDPLAMLAVSEPQYAALRIATAGLRHDARILEVGSGLGYTTFALRRAGFAHAIGCDLSSEAVQASKARYGPMFFTPDQLIDQTFDFVFATEVIEHIANPVDFVREQVSRLAPEGTLLLTTPRSLVSPGGPATAENVWVSDPPPVHLWCLTLDALRHAARQAGATQTAEIDVPLQNSILGRKVITSVRGHVLAADINSDIVAHQPRAAWKSLTLSLLSPMREDVRIVNWAVRKTIGRARDMIVLPSGKTEVLAVAIRR